MALGYLPVGDGSDGDVLGGFLQGGKSISSENTTPPNKLETKTHPSGIKLLSRNRIVSPIDKIKNLALLDLLVDDVADFVEDLGLGLSSLLLRGGGRPSASFRVAWGV